MRLEKVTLAILFTVAPGFAWAAKPVCMREDLGNVATSTPGPETGSKTDPEPGPLKGKVADGYWERLREDAKSVEARTEKDVRRKASRSPDERPVRDVGGRQPF